MANRAKTILALATISLAVFAMTPYGCNQLFNGVNNAGLKTHLAKILRSQGVDMGSADCAMIDSSRAGYCDFMSSQADIDKLVRVVYR